MNRAEGILHRDIGRGDAIDAPRVIVINESLARSAWKDRDPLTLISTAVVLLSVVLLASWLPARRAASIDPVAAMRI